MQIRSLFVTRLYQARLAEVDQAELEASCLSIAEDDEAGQDWCEENDFPGYTSYASLSDLPWRFPIFEALKVQLDAHVAEFAKELAFDLGGKPLVLEDLWINILPEGGIHTAHIHPHSVISGTTYVAMPDGTSASLNAAKERAFRPVPPELRQTLTVDNGKEFAGHERLSARLEMPVYFAYAYSSNERATNENTNGLLRQYFPKGTDFRDISHHELAFVTRRLNNRPRKRLNYLTPCEVLSKAGIALQM